MRCKNYEFIHKQVNNVPNCKELLLVDQFPWHNWSTYYGKKLKNYSSILFDNLSKQNIGIAVQQDLYINYEYSQICNFLYRESNNTVSVNKSYAYPARITKIVLSELYRYIYANNHIVNMILSWNLPYCEFDLRSLTFTLIPESDYNNYFNPDLFDIIERNNYNGIVHSLHTLLTPLGYNLGYS